MRNKMVFQRIASLLCVFVLLFSSLPSFAEETFTVTEPTPQEQQTEEAPQPAETIVVATADDQDIQNDQPQAEETDAPQEPQTEAPALAQTSALKNTGDSALFGVMLTSSKKNGTVEFTDENEYSAIAVTGTYKKNAPTVSRISADAPDGVTVLEAWAVDGMSGNTALEAELTLNALPETAWNEEIAVYSVKDGRAYELLADAIDVGGSVRLSLKHNKETGIALVKVGTGETLAPDSAIWANDALYLTGKMPGNAVVEATPVSVEIDGRAALSAYDIKIYANANQQAKGKPWKPAADKVTVHFYNADFNDAKGTLSVYHMETASDAPELVADNMTADNGWIEFDAASFSVYAVAGVIEKDVQIGNDVYHVTVEYDSDSGVPDGVILEAQEIEADTDAYAAYRSRAAETLNLSENSIVFARVLDISLKDPETLQDIPLNSSVRVSVELKQDVFQEDADIAVVHFAKPAAAPLGNLNIKKDISLPGQGTASINQSQGSAPATDAPASDYDDVPTLVASTVSGNTVAFDTDGFSVYVVMETVLNKTVTTGDGETYEISVKYSESAGIPMTGTALAVAEMLPEDADYEDFVREAVIAAGGDTENVEYSKVFDISIVDENDPSMVYEPAGPVEVSIRLIGETLDEYTNLDVMHFVDDGLSDGLSVYQLDSGIEGEVIQFSTNSFSVYVIVAAPPAITPEPTDVKTLADIVEDQGYKFCITRQGFTSYMTGNAGREQTYQFYGDTDENNAEVWYFESTSDSGKFYIYRLNGSSIEYIYVYDTQKMRLDTSDKTVFTVEENTNPSVPDSFYIYEVRNSKIYALSVRGNKDFFLELRNNGVNTNGVNTNECVIISKAVAIPRDPYGLDGKTFGIAYHEESVKGAGLIDHSSTNGKLDAVELLVRPDVLSVDGVMLISKTSDLTNWSFECVEGDHYYITTQIGGEKYYLTLGNNISLVTEAERTDDSIISVEAGTGKYAGKYKLTGSKSNKALTLQGGKASNGFMSSNNGGDYSWINLTSRSTLGEEDFIIYSAEKVDLSDTERVPNGAIVVVYTRIWNEEQKKYEFYAIDGNGKLIRCYESGDMIQWVGSSVSTAEWEFTEYYYEGTQEPNHYYELQNTYSGKYIAPQVSIGKALSNDTIGINMNGRRFQNYYSTILAWDDAHYSYVGLRASDDKTQVISDELENADSFYFAIMKPLVDSDAELHIVSTLNHKQYGITMKMIDLENGDLSGHNGQMSQFLRNNTYSQSQQTSNILSNKLGNDGYPIVTNGGASLKELIGSGREVNNLFISNTYFSTGYYEFDSTQNYASFWKYEKNTVTGEVTYTKDPSKFTVYSELGSYDSGGAKDTLKHGQFFPYNRIEPGVYTSTNNPYNLYNALAQELDDSNPRKGEKLHLIQLNENERNVDVFFAMELEASFTQTPSGLDAWGHDIIYEFTGDDDFWLYVDGELIIDLGGIHGALKGTVNYRTGEIFVNGKWTTIYECFKKNREDRGDETVDLAEIFEPKLGEDGKQLLDSHNNPMYTFKDYTNHTMRIFYMERGAGASNLRMRFNLAAVKPGTVELSKKISGVSNSESFVADYPFRIEFKINSTQDQEGQSSSDTWHIVEPGTPNVSVKYKDSTRDVTYLHTFTVNAGAEATTYNHVYMLKPGETAVIAFPESTYLYRVTECGLNTDVYEKVVVNKDTLMDTNPETSERQRRLYEQNDIYEYEVKRTFTAGERVDITSAEKEVEQEPRITFDNFVDAGAKGTLVFDKKLFKEDGTEPISNAESNNAIFRFRLYLGSENDDEIVLADKQKYHIKNELGEYCYWDTNQQKFASYEVYEYDNLTADQKANATFRTSINGMTDKIPVDYSIEVRELPAGSKFMVEERILEVPDGFSLKDYVKQQEESTGVFTSNTYTVPVEGTIANGLTSKVTINNIKGWGVRVMKEWSDMEWMDERDPVYFQAYIYDNSTLVPIENSIRRLSFGEASVYWFFETLKYKKDESGYMVVDKTLPTAKELKDIEIREVVLDGTVHSVNSNTGAVSFTGTAQIVNVNGDASYEVAGKETGDSQKQTFTYKFIKYEKGEVQPGANVRVDTMTNKRQGFYLYKTDWGGNPLSGAVFTLTANGQSAGGKEKYTSDANGLITVAYMKDNITYTLKEVASPQGYVGLSTELEIIKHGSDVEVTNKNASWTVTKRTENLSDGKDENGEIWWTLDDQDLEEAQLSTEPKDENIRYGQIIIKDKPYGLQIKKVDASSNDPLQGVTFDLYRQVIASNGQLRRDYDPLEGYTNLVTGEDGIVPNINGTLAPGSYYLYESQPLTSHRPLEDNVMLFTVSQTGTIILDGSAISQGVTVEESGSSILTYTIIVPNKVAEEAQLLVKKEVLNGTTADENGMHQFNFTAELFMPDGSKRWNYSDGGFTNGNASFYVTETTSYTLMVPVGAVVHISEHINNNYNATDSKFTVTVPGETTSSTSTYNSGGRQTIVQINDKKSVTLTYVNTRKTVDVTVKKKVKGAGKEFTFVAELTDGSMPCGTYTLFSNNGITYTTNSEGKVTFTLTPGNDGEKSQKFTVPYGSTLTIKEIEDENYTTKIEQTETNVKTFTNITSNNQSVTFTNEIKLNYPAPTGYGEDAAPFAVLLASGALLALVAGLRRRKRRE